MLISYTIAPNNYLGCLSKKSMNKGNIRRLILHMQKFDIEVFDEFGRYNYLNAQAILPSHTHSGMVEICYLSKGCQEYFVGKERYKMFGGDIFMTFPNEVHGTGDIPEEKGVLYWIVLKAPQNGGDYLGLSFDEASVLFNRILHIPVHLFKGNNECERLFQRITSVYFNEKGILTKIELNNLLVSLLLNIVRCGEMSSLRQYGEHIMKTVYYIDENIFEEFDLEELADKCNLSLSRFKHRFKEETGIPPAEYIIRKKVEKARTMIDENTLSIKDIAYDLGFSSPAYFSTVFKQYNGYSPSAYKMKSKKE